MIANSLEALLSRIANNLSTNDRLTPRTKKKYSLHLHKNLPLQLYYSSLAALHVVKVYFAGVQLDWQTRSESEHNVAAPQYNQQLVSSHRRTIRHYSFFFNPLQHNTSMSYNNDWRSDVVVKSVSYAVDRLGFNSFVESGSILLSSHTQDFNTTFKDLLLGTQQQEQCGGEIRN